MDKQPLMQGDLPLPPPTPYPYPQTAAYPQQPQYQQYPQQSYPQQAYPTYQAAAPTSATVVIAGSVAQCHGCRAPIHAHDGVIAHCHSCHAVTVVNVHEYHCLRRRFQRALWSGIVLLMIGIAVTITTAVLSAEIGGWYYVWFGPIIGGIFLIARGLHGLRRYPAHLH